RIAKAPPGLSTTPQPSSGRMGTVLQDTAALVNGVAPTGSIVFTLYPTSDCSGGFVAQESVPVNGNGSYHTVVGYQANVPGSYQWLRTYHGDGQHKVFGDAWWHEAG